MGAGAVGTGLVALGPPAFAAGLLPRGRAARAADNGPLTRGDVAILRFLAAAEITESDLWQQYNELGGIQDTEVPAGT